ncbi:MAG TPA: TetR/AcrR family transcriptional regulator [Rhizorhapis sp.]|nr:TetR/AcrR family transcriptional regulator [Rhizorhapis sp.]
MTQRKARNVKLAEKPGPNGRADPRAGTDKTAAAPSGASLLSSRKRDQIVTGAMKVFLEEGYHGASMDAIAAAARVSKPTLYNLVGNKEQLFEQILRRATDDILLPTRRRPSPEISLEEELYEFARHYADVLLTSHMLALHRLAIGEAQRFPRLGRLFYNAGPAKVLEGMSHYLAALGERGHLAISNPEDAGHHFFGLVINPVRNHLLFFGDGALRDDEIDRFVRSGLKAFLRAYAADPVKTSAKRRPGKADKSSA